MSRQDRQGVRTPADLEQKYDFGKTLSNLEGTVLKQGAQIETQGSKLNTLSGSLDSTGKDVDKLEISVAGLTNNVSSLQKRMTNAEKKDLEISNSISGLSEEMLKLWEYIYPVGCIYMSSDPTSPEELFGGEWEAITDVVIVGAGGLYEVNSTGGEAEHTLTVDEIPSHRHSSNAVLTGTQSSGTVGMRGANMDNKYNGTVQYTEYEGGGAAHNNMQPYIAKYVWERVA